jgi:hypothetical protein
MKRGGNRGYTVGRLAIYRNVDDLPGSCMKRGGNRDIGRLAIYWYVEDLPWSCMKRGGNSAEAHTESSHRQAPP